MVHFGRTDLTQGTVRLVIVLHLQAGYKRAVLGTTLLSNGKGHFGPTNQTAKRRPQDGPEYSSRTKPKWSVRFDVPTEISRILG